MNEEYQKLHEFMLNSGMTTLSSGDWYAKYSQPENFDKFYSAISDPNTETPFTTNLGKEDFYAKYMSADVKKRRSERTGRTFHIACGWGANFCGITVVVGNRSYRIGITRTH